MGTQYFEQFLVSNSEHRFRLYACIATVGTAIEMFCIGVYGGGFGRNAHGCSFMVTRPDGKPTFFELLTFYLMQYVQFRLLMVLQASCPCRKKGKMRFNPPTSMFYISVYTISKQPSLQSKGWAF